MLRNLLISCWMLSQDPFHSSCGIAWVASWNRHDWLLIASASFPFPSAVSIVHHLSNFFAWQLKPFHGFCFLALWKPFLTVKGYFHRWLTNKLIDVNKQWFYHHIIRPESDCLEKCHKLGTFGNYWFTWWPRSPLSLRGSMVELRSMESVGVGFDPSWGLRDVFFVLTP